MNLPKYYMNNSQQIEEYCKIIFSHAGIKSIEGKLKVYYASCLVRATDLEMKRTGYVSSVSLQSIRFPSYSTIKSLYDIIK